MRVGKLGALIAICFVMVACDAPVDPLTKADIANSKNVIEQSEAKQYPPPAPVITQSGPYVDTKKISLIQPPAWLKRQVTFNGSKLPFSFYVDAILSDTGALVNYQDKVDKKKMISLEYSGTIEGALKELATQTGYNYDIDKKHNLIWSAFKTKTYDISFVPGTSQFQMGKAKGTAGEANGIGGSSVSGFDTSDEQYSKLMGDISVWQEMSDTIQSLLSDEGKVHTSLATTTLTVHDHPGNIANITKYIHKMNRELSRQVRLQVQIIEVTLNNNFAFGIDWDLVYKVGNQTIALVNPGFKEAASEVPNFPTSGVSQFVFNATGTTHAKSPWLGSNTIIESLQLQGQVRVLTQPALVSLNNQVAQLAVQEMQNYVKEISTTLNENQSETSVITDTLSTGMMLYMLPKVKNTDVFLQVTSNLSELLALDNVAVDGSTTTEIQLPKIAQRIINQRAVVPSGATLVLSGFKSLKDANATDKFFGIELLGARAARKVSNEIVILITPTILTSEKHLDPEFDLEDES